MGTLGCGFCRFEIEMRCVTAFEIGAKNIAGWIPQENSIPARCYPRTSEP